MDLPKRKHIRLKNYDYAQNNVYFVTICTHKRAPLFATPVGATLCGRPNSPEKMIEKWLSELQKKFANLKIHKSVIMPDHIHIILHNPGSFDEQTRDHTGSPLPKIVEWFKTMTTNEYIRGVRDGIYAPFDKHVWQRNYYEHIIRNENDYEDIWQYIDGNPSKHAESP